MSADILRAGAGIERCRALLDKLPTREVRAEEWRAAARGRERIASQQFVLDIARNSVEGTLADRLALYKAAYLILPLHGADLEELARLLVRARPVPLEWRQPLVCALHEQRSKLTGDYAEIVRALDEAPAPAALIRAEELRAKQIDRFLGTAIARTSLPEEPALGDGSSDTAAETSGRRRPRRRKW